MSNRTFVSERFHYTYGPHKASFRIQNGETIEVVCPSGDNRLADGSELSKERRQRSDGTALFEGNPLAGPILIENLRTDNCLAVDILKVDIESQEGLTLLAPRHGLLTDDCLTTDDDPDDFTVPRRMYRWHINNQDQVAVLQNTFGSSRWTIPLRPMIGSIGVCPAWGEHISSLNAGTFGGNLDLPILEAGATILLPVFHPEGMLFVGDLHAAQGHGEIVGGAIEVSGKVELRVRNLPRGGVCAPLIFSRNYVYAVATDGDLRQAVSLAYSRLLHWLSGTFDWNRWDTYQLISQTGVVEIGGIVVRPCFTVAAGVPIKLLPVESHREIEKWRGSAGP